ncbi:hypothetical protein L3Q82_022668 [Scortum barcoo]|uniref:Uncharacterized protein n=1 Tax=Scortum barcoo TaxID=214431 RepID=A0ACB8WWT5_9TELE|nr:hypothetical protein L3Q82_022668 [Scortum barcoo]
MNRWVDPSFTDFPGESFSLSGGRTSSQVLFRAEPKRSRKRKGETFSSDPHTAYVWKESAQRNQDEPWVDRYSPRSQTELAVHKKKIEEVENWMRIHTGTSKGGILLLMGPSGCGKTATIQVLSHELGLRVHEWTNPTILEPYSHTQHEWGMNGLSYTSQLAQFRDFLLRANKYNCLKMAGDEGCTYRKLILVEEFPNQFYRQPGSLHDILRHFVKTSRCPLVFIVSDSLNGDGSSRLLFPKEIQEELDISSISFNPVAPTTMMKVLTRISTLETGKSCRRMCVPNQAVLEMLCSGSSGDIRSAINSLQFSSLPAPSLEKGLLKMKKDSTVSSLGKAVSRKNQRKKSKQTKEQEEEQAIGGKDASLFLFRALGKILHCKRGEPESAEAAKCAPRLGLPSHLSHHHREMLLEDPELVVERSHMSGEFFNLYLHQNYLDFFSEVEDVERASSYLSDADLLTADWTCRSTMKDYGSSVATRGLLHSNSRQVSVGFRPLHKPYWLAVNKKHWENCLVAQALFRSFCLTPVSLQTELLPYLAKLTNPMKNQGQITFIQDVGQMSLRRFPSRLKLEALTDKEPGQLEIDSEEEQGKGNEEDFTTRSVEGRRAAPRKKALTASKLRFDLVQMQEVSESCSLEDDMVDGDLGDGMGVRAAPSSTGKKSQSVASVTETLLPGAERRRCSTQAGQAAWIPGLKTTGMELRARWKLPHSSPLVDLSKDELKDRLQEATEVIDLLCCELEVAHRYLEGKYEALKILQGKAILDKATSHTKSLLHKSEERAKALEKEVNRLQWEFSFNQVQIKKSQQSWEQKYNTILSENKSLTDHLEETESEIQQLRAENSALSRQCLELLSMLNVKEQRVYQGTKPQYSPEKDASVLELAVLGACQCLGVTEACPCSRTAAASRKQLVQLQQELDAQHLRREEALMVADAFRIAFEQQLRKRSEHFLLLAEANILKSHHCKAEGNPLLSVSKRLRGLLPSSFEVNMPGDLVETLYRLLDLLNDKEEALAHQRKVSIMLAHSAEELQRQLLLDSHCKPTKSSETHSQSQQTSDTSESKIQQVSSESNIQAQQH